MDNDGDLDLLVNGQRDFPPLQGYTTLLYRNDQPHANVAPSAPTDLHTAYTSNTAILTWAAASDENQSGGLTYNVRIGTTPGGIEILSPMSSSSGYRHVPKPGNSGWLRRKLINGLERGRTYYWSVQAVDNSYTGSSFASEASFTIGTPPKLEMIEDLTVDEDGSASVTLMISVAEGSVGLVTASASAINTTLLPAGSLTLTRDGAEQTLLIKPTADRHGISSVEVTVEDPQGGQASRFFLLTVRPVNDAPRAETQSYAVAEDSILQFTLPAVDPESDSLRYLLKLGPWRGELSGSNGAFAYTPTTDFYGQDWCDIEIVDEHGAATAVRLNFAVTPVTDVSEVRMGVRSLADDTPLMILRGEPYQTYFIEESSDLQTWTPLDTFFSADGRIEFIGQASSPDQNRFYRAREP